LVGFFETGIESFDCSRLIFGDFLIFSKVVCNSLLVNLSANSSTTRSGADPVSSFFIALCNSLFLSRFACSRYFLIISSLGFLLKGEIQFKPDNFSSIVDASIEELKST